MLINRRCLVSILVLNITTIQLVIAQDAHYWTNQYGTQAQILGGVVVDSIKDLSSTFYNPGDVALPTNSTLMITS